MRILSREGEWEDKVAQDETVLIERRISRGVIERSSTARNRRLIIARHVRARVKRMVEKTRRSLVYNWLRTARRVTGYKLIASRLLELPQRQLIPKPIKSNGEPVFSS